MKTVSIVAVLALVATMSVHIARDNWPFFLVDLVGLACWVRIALDEFRL